MGVTLYRLKTIFVYHLQKKILMFTHASSIGIDIGRNFLEIAVIKIDGEIISELSYPLLDIQSKTYIIGKLLEAISEIRRKVALDGINPMCIGIAAKGFVDHREGIVLGPDQGIEEWKDVPLSRIINKETMLPVYVGNDANMMTIAEHRFGAAKGYKNIVFVALRTGIGGGIIINEKLYRGTNNAGGEVGQMIIKFDGEKSSTGIRGSFEHYASASAIVRRYYESSGKKPDLNLHSKDIFELSYKNDIVAREVIKENAKMVGVGLANLISIFAPEIVVVGGGLSKAGNDYFELIKESAFENSLENCRSEVIIERALLGSRASLLGSAYYSLTRLAGKDL